MKLNLRSSPSLLGVAAVFVCALLIAYFPAVPKSFLGWAALLFVGLPVWFFLEWFGGVVLQSQFFSRLPSIWRVLIAIPVLILLMFVAVLLVKLVRQLIVFPETSNCISNLKPSTYSKPLDTSPPFSQSPHRSTKLIYPI
jgi:hypothetical protein